MNKWDLLFLRESKLVSSMSKDPSTKVGAVVANGKEHIQFGYNGFPSRVEDKPEWYADRDIKYKLVTHGEINAIINAKQDVTGCTVYTWPLPPCAACAALLGAYGIKRVVSWIDLSATSTKRYLDPSETEFILEANQIEYEWHTSKRLLEISMEYLVGNNHSIPRTLKIWDDDLENVLPLSLEKNTNLGYDLAI